MEFKYRKGTSKDLEALNVLGLNAYSIFSDELGKENWEQFYNILNNLDMYDGLIKSSICFVCEIEDRIVGMVFIIPNGNPTSVFKSEWSYIRMLAVDPNYKNLGIGKNLIEKCIEHAIQTNENHIALHTSEFMSGARHIYEELGFKIIRELESKFGKKYWLYLLNLNKNYEKKL